MDSPSYQCKEINEYTGKNGLTSNEYFVVTGQFNTLDKDIKQRCIAIVWNKCEVFGAVWCMEEWMESGWLLLHHGPPPRSSKYKISFIKNADLPRLDSLMKVVCMEFSSYKDSFEGNITVTKVTTPK